MGRNMRKGSMGKVLTFWDFKVIRKNNLSKVEYTFIWLEYYEF